MCDKCSQNPSVPRSSMEGIRFSKGHISGGSEGVVEVCEALVFKITAPKICSV